MGSAEMLESSGAISTEAIKKMQEITEEFDKLEILDEAAFEDMTARCQAVVAKYGSLHIASVAPASR